jgi:hypothetical protein
VAGGDWGGCARGLSTARVRAPASPCNAGRVLGRLCAKRAPLLTQTFRRLAERETASSTGAAGPSGVADRSGAARFGQGAGAFGGAAEPFPPAVPRAPSHVPADSRFEPAVNPFAPGTSRGGAGAGGSGGGSGGGGAGGGGASWMGFGVAPQASVPAAPGAPIPLSALLHAHPSGLESFTDMTAPATSFGGARGGAAAPGLGTELIALPTSSTALEPAVDHMNGSGMPR